MRVQAALVAGVASMTIAACGGGHDTSANVPAANSSVVPASTPDANAPVATADTTTRRHHSALAGAAAGAVAGHMLGRHAVAGAAVGALVQHERNKHGKY
jgi:hypothetical protein